MSAVSPMLRFHLVVRKVVSKGTKRVIKKVRESPLGETGTGSQGRGGTPWREGAEGFPGTIHWKSGLKKVEEAPKNSAGLRD